MNRDAKNRLRGRANVVAEQKLKPWHEQYPRVNYSKAHAANFTFAALRRGYSEKQIEGAYFRGLERYQAFATDLSLCDLEPSGLIYDANRRLALNKPENPNFAAKPAHTM